MDSIDYVKLINKVKLLRRMGFCMNVIMIILISTLIGACIGGLTNFMAIAMLFRPYKSVKLGTWKVPFTPGLIPKRHQEIAYQLGELVEKQLVPVETIRKKVTNPTFQREIQEWITEEMRRWMHSKKSLNQIFSFFVKHKQDIPDIDNQVEQQARKVVEPFVDFIILKIEEFLYSEEGEEFLYQSIQKVITKQGALGNMLGVFIIKEKLIDKLRPVLLYALRQPSTKEQLHRQMYKAIEDLLNKEIEDLLAPFEKELFATIPSGAARLTDWLDKQIPEWIAALQVSQLVREQVLAFPLERLEMMIRDLAKKELKMITWLGAVLGGIIGFIQAIIITLFIA